MYQEEFMPENVIAVFTIFRCHYHSTKC